MKVLLNLNDTVKAKVTPYGWGQYKLDLQSMFINPEPFAKVEDENGFSEWQLWELMQAFGGYVGLGLEQVLGTELEVK